MGHAGASCWFLVAAVLGLGCSAVYPELTTQVREVPPGYRFEPPPPADILYIELAKATIPERTRDGRAWDSVGGSLPDAVAKLIVNKKELIVTPVHSNTLTPTWPNQKRGNYRIPLNADVRVELWDSNPINNHPICFERIRALHEQASTEGPLEVTCDSGATVALLVEPARGRIGTGLFYEIRSDAVFVTRVLSESPASRASLARGDQIVRIVGEPVRGMDEKRIRSLMNAHTSTGLKLTVRAKTGTEREVELRDGPLYPTLDEAVR